MMNGMWRSMVWMACLSFFLQCKEDARINDHEMMFIIEKLHECEAYNELKFKNVDTFFLANCSKSVFKDLKVDTTKYYNTLSYYRKNPKKFESFYDTLLKKIEAKQDIK